jgi:hypothetical protein
VRERRKEPREGSEIDPETACIQTVGAPAQWAFGFFGGARSAAQKNSKDEIDLRQQFYERDSDGVHRSEGDFGSRSEAKVSPARWTRRESIVQG